MNFIAVDLAGTTPAGAARVTLPGGAVLDTGIALPRDAAPKGWTLGVRPEALLREPGGALSGRVEVIERLGERTLLHIQLADSSLVVADARGAAEPATGDAVQLGAQPGRLHLFDADGRAHRTPVRTGAGS
ncbi:MAG: TOBE domain-containing protein [Microbacteriaceae bacterium]|nr:TOBE domain-containing protein [Burkholderiaceae bacterium]